MRRVQMLTVGPNGGYLAGEVLEVDDARAESWVADGHAEYTDKAVGKPKQKKQG